MPWSAGSRVRREQGHNYINFAKPEIQKTLLRGIAWAANNPVDELVNYQAPRRKGRNHPQQSKAWRLHCGTGTSAR